MSGRPRQPAVSPAEELRELTREAHAAVKDLRQAIAEARTVVGQVTAEMTEAMTLAANKEIKHMQRHLQDDANTNTASLQHAVDAARQAIIRALRPEVLEPLADGTIRVRFEGGNFDPQPVDLGEEVDDGEQ